MAAIDKIYLRRKDYLELKEWCNKQPPLYDKYGKRTYLKHWIRKINESNFKDEDTALPVMCSPYYIDAYLIRNCPIVGVQKELMLNYGYWSQERIKEYYEQVKSWDQSKGSYPYWARLKDFSVNEDGTITLDGLEKSDYELIKEGKLYNSPVTPYKYEIGNHIICKKHPLRMYNTALNCKYWFVSVLTPEGLPYMWYHSNTNTWDFSDEFVIGDNWVSSSCVKFKTIRAIKRNILKWKLPVGSIVRCTGRYIGDTYEFKTRR